jgi:hypothetical protein
VRLFLGIPSGGSPAPPFLDAVRDLRLPSGTTAFERAVVSGNFVPAQREILVARALEWGADAVAMIDDDMVPPPDALEMLCDLLRSDAVAGIAGSLYYSRDGLRPMAVDGWDARDTRSGWIPAFDDRTPVAVTGVGFGCAVVRAEAVRHMSRPLFAAQIYLEYAAGRARVCNEDYLFCARLRDAGYAAVLHPGVRCGHYDRAAGVIQPRRWEPPQVSSVARLLVRSDDSYAMVPLADAPAESAAERQVKAEVTYVETP